MKKNISKFFLRLDANFNWVPEEYDGSGLFKIVGNMPIGTIIVAQQTYKEFYMHQVLQATHRGDKQAFTTGGEYTNDLKSLSHDRLGGILGIPTDEVEQELIKLFEAYALII